MGENRDDHGGIFNGRDEGQGAAALRTGGEVDGERVCESLRPAHARPCGSRGGITRLIGGVRGRVGLAGTIWDCRAALGASTPGKRMRGSRGCGPRGVAGIPAGSSPDGLKRGANLFKNRG